MCIRDRILDSADDDESLAGVDSEEDEDVPPLEESSDSDVTGEDVDPDIYIDFVSIDETDLQAVLQQVKTNKLGFTKRQVEQAHHARELYHMCGAPTVEKFKLLLKTGFLHNCPVTADDVNNAEKILDPTFRP